jgi:hypothetical protein
MTPSCTGSTISATHTSSKGRSLRTHCLCSPRRASPVRCEARQSKVVSCSVQNAGIKERSIMSPASRSAILSLCFLWFVPSLSAQDETRVAMQRLSPVITAATAGGQFRFSSPAGVAQIRVQIISANGEAQFDSTWKDGSVLDWPIESPSQPLGNGLYRCVVMVSDLDGRVTQREANPGVAAEGARTDALFPQPSWSAARQRGRPSGHPSGEQIMDVT